MYTKWTLKSWNQSIKQIQIEMSVQTKNSLFVRFVTMGLHQNKNTRDTKTKHTADFPCSTCDKLFKSEIGMKTHKKIHKDTKFQCDICNLICVTKTRFNNHARTHVEKLSKYCPICGKMFSKLSFLRKHQKAIHFKENNSSSCSLCPKTFPNDVYRKRHEKFAHRNQFGLECHVCKKSNPTKQALSIHMTTHSDQKPNLPCPECGKLFSAKHLLRHHILYVHEFATTRCDICQTMIKTNYLKVHTKSHTEQDNPTVKCEYCSCDFRMKHIKIHMKTHTRQDLKCEFCSKIFQQDSYLKKHVQTIHTKIIKNTVFQCNICNQTCQNNSKLQKHMTEVHMDERPYPCPHCKKAFKRKPHLKDHLVLHSDTKAFKCKVCDTSFASSTTFRTHKFLHTNEKPYKCGKCEQAFRQRHHLKGHISRQHTG